MSASPAEVRALTFPELVIGIAGPIGVDLDQIAISLGRALATVQYTSELVKLTTEMERFPVTKEDLQQDLGDWKGTDTFNTYMRKMSQANALRKQNGDPAVLARIAIDTIQLRRADHTGDAHKVRSKHAYIVRQLKRPEEVALLRKVYGRQFILVSAYAPEKSRREKLCERLKQEFLTTIMTSDISYHADRLIERDASEDGESLGQQLRDTFHHADVFIDGINKQEMDNKITRFIDAFFGRNDISPSKDEYGMYTAKSASLRSADLSRQVGAALFLDGEMVTQGCNEVPKAFGGAYWDLEKPDHRDITKGQDPNEFHKREILREVIERLRASSFLSEPLLNFGSDSEIVEALIAKPNGNHPAGALRNARINDLTEYGRVVHAEMLAICDAARTGRSVKGTTLYCTTFPCHNCTKHILASGIYRVVYMEPYPKSRAKDLHPDEIEIEAESETRVGFVPFMGISPVRYRDIFQKGRRKRDDGRSNDWSRGEPAPMIDFVLPTYTYSEDWALAELLGGVVEKRSG
jgi:deoxycytidylate deaminase